MTDAIPADAPATPSRRRARGPSPTARALAWARQQGWDAGVVERRLPGAFITKDMFGFADLVVLAGALGGPGGIMAVQVTSTDHVANRMAKIALEPRARRWLACGGWIEVWGWAQRGKRGARKRWTLRRVAARRSGDELVWIEVPA